MLGLRVFLAFCLCLCFGLCFGGLCLAALPATGELLAPGVPAPQFVLPDANGRLWDLAELLDRPLVLYFYPKDDSPGCTREACSFRDDAALYDSLGVRVVGISTDPPESHRRFAEKHRLSFLLLSDTLGAVVRSYGADVGLAHSSGAGRGTIARRVTYLIDRDGVIRRVYPKVDPATHSAEILAEAAQVFGAGVPRRPASSSDRKERSGR